MLGILRHNYCSLIQFLLPTTLSKLYAILIIIFFLSRSYLSYLLLHSLNLIFSRLHLTTKFFDLVVQYKFKLLQFLIFLLQTKYMLFL